MKQDKDDRPKSPGLKWRARKNGPPVPYWFATKEAIDAGYPVKSANLSFFAGNNEQIVQRCVQLQFEMQMFLSGEAAKKPVFDGTFGSLLSVYEVDPESSYRNLKHNVRSSYDVYIALLRTHIGSLLIDASDGRDAKRWFATWRADPDGSDHLPRARLILSVLKAAISFGIVCRLDGCREFKSVLAELEFPTVPSRTWAPIAAQVVAAREAAHAAGAPSRALVYALQFEATLRQWDIVGQWVPLSDPRPSAILRKGMKWIGPMWSAVGDNMLLKIKPSKTEKTTGVEVSFDLLSCPMVMEELDKVPPAARHGPLIPNEKTGLPYIKQQFNDGWRADFRAAGLPDGLWNRDMRAGGVTEGGMSGASKDDRRKVAGHAREATTEIYDRDQVEAHRRVMKSRTAYRDQNRT